jgi:hypothetical protein
MIILEVLPVALFALFVVKLPLIVERLKNDN